MVLRELFVVDVYLPKTSWKAVPQPWPAASKHRSPKLL